MANKNSSKKIAIVGAGISGLSAAYRLISQANTNQFNLEVTVFESSDRTGGVIRTERVDDRIVELGPDSMLSTKPAAVDLINEIGLKNDLIRTNSTNRRSMVASSGKLHALPEGFVMLAPTRIVPFLLSPLFSLDGKARMALDLVSPARESQQDETVESFIIRRFGIEALDKVVQPMVGGIYVGDVAKLSARSTIPQFVELERKFGSVIRGLLARAEAERAQESTASGARYSMFVSLKNGVQTLIDRLESKVGLENIERGIQVLGLRRSTGDQWLLECSTGEREFDSVILATPAKISANILKSAEPLLAQKLSSIKSASTAVVNLLYKRSDITHPLDAFGFVVPSTENRSILAASVISNKFARRAPSGTVAIRVFIGGILQPDLLKNSDEELTAIAHTDLKHYLGVKRAPQSALVTRYPESMPQYNVGHQACVEEIMAITQERMPGVFLTGNSYKGVGIPDCISNALRTAQAAIEYANAPLNVEFVTS
jgi:protoporphyrinogen/coproporphyrinogen III oxidase